MTDRRKLTAKSTRAEFPQHAPLPRGQITKRKYCQTLSLTDDEYKKLFAYGKDVCLQCSLFDKRSTLRDLEKNNPNVIESAGKKVYFERKATDYECSFRNPKGSNALKIHLGLHLVCCNLYFGTVPEKLGKKEMENFRPEKG